MKIVNLNTWCGRIKGVPEYLASLNADVYCLQEVTSAPQETADYLMYEGNGATPEPQRTKFFDDLRSGLPGYQAYYLPSVRGYLHDGAKVKEPVFYGIATFVRDTVPVIGAGSRFVYGEYRADTWGEPPLPRIAHAVRLWDYASDSSVTVAHMHGMWIKEGKEDKPIRKTQTAKFLSLLQSVACKEDKRVVCGDFNILPTSEFFVEAEKIYLHDLVAKYGITDTRTHYYKKEVRYADYMLVNSFVKEKSFEVPAMPAVSDHRPLILEF